MNFIKRAYLHTVRKKGKSLLLFCVLLVMSTMILTCFSIKMATDTAALNIRKSLKGGFTIDVRSTQSYLTDNVINKVTQIGGVKDYYNARTIAYAEYRQINGKEMDIRTEGAYEVVAGFEHAGKLIIDIFSERDISFVDEGFELLQGRHIIKGDKNTAVIHQDFARRNSLNLGDTFILALNSDMFESGNAIGYEKIVDNQTEVRIIGIYHNTIPLEVVMPLSHIFYENTVFIDPLSYIELYAPGNSFSYSYADFHVDDPAELDGIIAEMKTINGEMEWDKITVIRHDTEYQNAKKPLAALNKWVSNTMIITILASAVLLFSVLALWVRSRIHETASLLSMGYGKVDVIAQHIVEIMIIGFFAFWISFAVSSLIAQNVGDIMLLQSAPEKIEVVKLTSGSTSAEMVENKTAISVTVTVSDLISAFVIGIAIILISVTMADFPIIRLKPKKILSIMS